MHTAATPSPRLEPTEIANDTFLVHAHCMDDRGLIVPVNSLVLRSLRPGVIDTGLPVHRDQFLHDVFSLVRPDDLRWVVTTHDDVDHAGNVNALMAAAPHVMVLDRMVLGGDADRIDIGDRVLSIVRPPLHDAPDTMGLFDPTTGVYWSADCFGTTLREIVRSVAELDPDDWDTGIVTFAHLTAPLLNQVDQRTFGAAVDIIEGLGASVIVGTHTPVIDRDQMHRAFASTRRAPGSPVPAHDVLRRLRHLLGG